MPEISVNAVCKVHGDCDHVLENPDTKNKRIRCKKCRTEAVARKRRALKAKAVEYLGGECGKCGYSKCVAALEFHHSDPTKKDFSISQSGITYSWEKIKAELDKCELVCSNCHKETHYEEFTKSHVSVHTEIRACKGCGKEFETLTKGIKTYCHKNCRKR